MKTGSKHSLETCQKMSKAARGNQNGKGNQNFKGMKHALETRLKISKALTGRKLSPETCRNMSEATKRQWADPVYREMALKQLANMPRKDTKIERLIRGVLERLRINFQLQAVFSINETAAIADFFLPDENIVIECDGGYWHSSPEAKRKDHIKDQLYESLGLQVIRLPEKSILTNPLQALLSGLEKIR